MSRPFVLVVPVLAIVAYISLTCRPDIVGADSSTDGGKSDAAAAKAAAMEKNVTQGALRTIGKDGNVVECPLKHTHVAADVSGFIARVSVTQTFHNPTAEKIEAVYVFPLPHEAAVDDMTMVIGERKIVGLIKRRDEARRIYEQALMQGQTAALLEQERPNIFTQSVGNIDPGQEVKIEISYVDVLKYDVQQYEFHFPMVVGPRFIPGTPSGSTNPNPKELQGKVSPPVSSTDRVPDAHRITPPVLRPEMRNGHDISLTLNIAAGVPVQNISVPNHQADVKRHGESKAVITLSPADSVPNKDFVVRYDVVGKEPEMAVLAHTGNYSGDVNKLGNGYFMMMIQPREDERLKKSPPREMVFLVDVSGSMRGAKTDKTRETMQNMLGLCRDKDTVQVITFASQAHKLFERPLPVNESSIQRALNFTSGLRGGGGTRMLQGVKLAIDEPIDKDRLRIIVMLTDGFIGNEAEIIQHVGKNCGDQVRFWTIGIGQSPNMFLVDGVARQGGGMGKRLGLNDEAELLATEVMTRIQRAQLSGITIDWGDARVIETYPTRIPELWAGRPVVVYGRYADGGRHQIQVSGKVEGEPVRWPLTVDLPDGQPAHDVLAKVWARQKIEDLMQQTYYLGSPAVEEEVTGIALDYRLMTQYTSFVAVDQSKPIETQPTARPPRRMLVPVPLPEGAVWEGFFGETSRDLSEAEDAFSFYSGARFQVDRLSSLQREKKSQIRYSVPASRTAGRAGSGWGYSPGPTGLSAVRGEAVTPYYRQLGRGAVPAVRRGRAAGLARHVMPSPVALGFGSQPAQSSGGSSGSGGGGFGGLGDVDDGLARGTSWARAALRADGQPVGKHCQAALKLASEMQEKGDFAAARRAFERAAFLDRAAANLLASNGQIAANALAKLVEIHKTEVAQWTKQVPALAKRLEIVIRDASISEALRQVAGAGGMDIKLLPGSVDDAQRITIDSVRVRYLDLRGATVAQALDWILQPARLSWHPDEKAILAASTRRLPGRSAWVYDVSMLAFPSEEETKDLKDQNKLMALIKNASDKFLQVVRRELKDRNDDALFWFGPGQLLVFGDPEMHAATSRLLTGLASPVDETKLTGETAKLQRNTSKRAKAWKQTTAKLAEVRRRAMVADTHATYAWQLLVGAAKGQLDDEAMTQLQIAWNNPATIELVRGKERLPIMRSLWAVTEAARALPANRELARLADSASDLVSPLMDDVCRTVREAPNEPSGLLALVFGSLALRDHADARATCLETLSGVDAQQGPGKLYQLAAKTLLVDSDQLDTAGLQQLAASHLGGEDSVALLAMACRHAGPDVWRSFRIELSEIARKVALQGHIVVFINRLAEERIALAN